MVARQEKLEKEDKEDKEDKDDSKADEKIDPKDVDARIDAMIKIGEKRGYNCTSSLIDDHYFVDFSAEKVLEDESLMIMIKKDGTVRSVDYHCNFLPDLSNKDNLRRCEEKISNLVDMVKEFYDKGLIDSEEYYTKVEISDEFNENDFQDYDHLYLVMDLLTGGDLRYHISKNNIFTEKTENFI